MAAINCYVDRGATLKNLSCKKGTHQYANDSELSNSLKSILAGSIRCGDRLHAAGIIEADKCTHSECGAKRHTTMHVFSECLRHKKRRDKCELDVQKVILYAHQHVGELAVSNLKEVLSNSTFQVTGICPDDMMALAMDTRKCDTEKVKENVPKEEQIIYDATEGLIYEDLNGVNLPTAYTDGSLLDPDVENFQRAGWGFYVAPGHSANVAKSLELLIHRYLGQSSVPSCMPFRFVLPRSSFEQIAELLSY
jgi:hypothetical protein